MPVPASDAIASDIGHGRLGLRTGLRPFVELLSESAGQRHVWAELRPTKYLNGTWTAGASNTYRHDLSETHDGVLLWPRGVLTDTETLAAVDSLAGCEAATGTFYYDTANARLWVHLTGNANPAATEVSAQVGLAVGSEGVFQPWLGAERLTNGALEAWTGTNPDGWTIGSSGSGVTLDKTSAALEGSYAARFTASSAGSGDYRSIRQSISNEAVGARYRFSGAYRVSTTAGSLVLRLFLEDSSSSLEADGVTSAGSVIHFAELGDTAGEWRRFSFDVLMPSWGSDPAVQFRAYAGAASTSGTVDVDDVRWQHVPDLVFYDPMLALEGVPQIEAARPDSFYGQISTGVGTLTLLNGGGFWESRFAELDWINAEVIMRVGGRFTAGGDEVPLEDCPIFVRARIARPEVEDDQVRLGLEDQRSILHERLPLETFDTDSFPNLRPQDYGRPRAMLLGRSTPTPAPTFGNLVGQIRPTLVDLTTDGFGVYEISDPSYTSAGETSILAYSYLDRGAADSEDSTRRILLTSNPAPTADYSRSPRDGTGLGRITILQPVSPVVIDENNHVLDFNIGGAALVANMDAGMHRPAWFWYALEYFMNAAASVSDISVEYDASTGKVVIAKAAGTLTLLCKTGSNRDVACWRELGFDTDADRSGSLSYVGDNPVFTDPDQHILRVDRVDGICDDASGTYTGTAYASLDYASELAHYVLGAVFRLPPEQIDTASFVAARTDSLRRRKSAFYLGAADEQITFGELLERIETLSGADVRIVNGRWTWTFRSSIAEAGIVDLVDSDYLAFSGSYEEADLQEIIVVGLTPNPVTGRYQTCQRTDASLRVRFGQRGQRTFFTTTGNVAEITGVTKSRLAELADEAQTKRRRFRFSVKGKALLRPVGSQLRLTRTGALDPTGSLDGTLVRIIEKRDDLVAWKSDIAAIEIRADFWLLGVTGRSELGVSTRLSH